MNPRRPLLQALPLKLLALFALAAPTGPSGTGAWAQNPGAVELPTLRPPAPPPAQPRPPRVVRSKEDQDRIRQLEADNDAKETEVRRLRVLQAAPPAPAPTLPTAPAHTPGPRVASSPPPAPAPSPSAPPRTVTPYPGGPILVALPQATTDVPGTLLGQEGGAAYAEEKPRYRVRVPYRLYMGETEVTFAQWDACADDGRCERYKPQTNWGRGEQPIMNVRWTEVQGYLAWLNDKAHIQPYAPDAYRLPTEAEWEYAARAGSDGEFSLGPNNKLPLRADTANYNTKYQYKGSPQGPWRERTVEVKSDPFKPNAWGLYHMHGNVWEWVQDCYNEYEYQRRAQKSGGWLANETSSGSGKNDNCTSGVLRGGSWINGPQHLRSAFRLRATTGFRVNDIGFRVARTLP